MRSSVALFSVIAASLIASGSAAATTITINNVNAAGVGFNDQTIVPALPSNSATKLGQQRLNVFQKAADQWAKLINSPVPIVVDAKMIALMCTSTTATLGSAGPVAAVGNFANAPIAGTLYSIAEANSLAGSDLSGSSDINAQFNVNLGNAGCLDGAGWWYGTDPADPSRPASATPLLPVVFHELGHGLGFLSFASITTGAYPQNIPDIWSNYLFDTSTDQRWRDMSSSQRIASATNDPFLVWTGRRTNKQAGEYLEPGPALLINSPNTLPSPNSAGTASFGPAIPAAGITNTLVYVDDGNNSAGTGSTVHDGCEAFGGVSGKIALIDRGLCSFIIKVKNAQNAGAVAAVIANNSGPAIGLGGTDATITIPSIGISQPLGAAIEAALGSAAVNVTIGFARTDQTDGCIRMFAPSPAQSGSSVSHFHSDATPNLLMEPVLNTTLFNTVDLTLPLFQDIGWSVNKIEDFIYTDAFDPNVCQHAQP